MLLYLWHSVLLTWLAPCHSEITIISELSDPRLCLEQYPTLPMGVTPLTSQWSSRYIYVSFPNRICFVAAVFNLLTLQ